ncbi:hypothetical protein CRENBAI_019221 [Crenichthys baileyi]|uniref:Uncharacterized protein n=1 Tax=Crenichthys baileyi TaxID=28760 RepID=A0AAV9SAP8_9TELE
MPSKGKKCKKTGHFAVACYTEEKTLYEVITEDEPPRTTLNIANAPMTFKTDSRADTSSEQLNSPGGTVTTRGQFMAKIRAEVNNKWCDCYFRIVVVKSRGETLLGRAIARKLGLIKRLTVNKVNIFGDVSTLKEILSRSCSRRELSYMA